MKKFFWVMSLMLSLSLWCSAQEGEGTHFEDLSFEEALAKAKELNKKVFVDCYTQWCGPCKMMARRIFPQKVCGDYFNPLYVCIMKDMQKGDGLEIARKYKVRMYPTFLVLNADGSLLFRYEAGASRDANEFVQNMSAQVLLAEKKQVFEKGGYDEKFMVEFLALLEQHDLMYLQKVMDQVMAQWGVDQISHPASWAMLKRVLRSSDHALFRKVFEHRQELASKLGKEDVENYLMGVYSDEFRVMKAMDLNWDQRMSDLNQLVADGYVSAPLLKTRLYCYQVVSKKKTDSIDDLLKIVKRLKKTYSTEEERVAVLKEMVGIHRLVQDPAQRKAFRSALEKLLPSFEKHSALVNELIGALQ